MFVFGGKKEFCICFLQEGKDYWVDKLILENEWGEIKGEVGNKLHFSFLFIYGRIAIILHQVLVERKRWVTIFFIYYFLFLIFFTFCYIKF